MRKKLLELKQFIKSYVQSHSFIKSLVLGISGGQDSTLVGKLVQMSVNELREEGIDCTVYSQLNYLMEFKRC